MIYNIIDVADYLIRTANKHGHPMSNMFIHKLLYIANGYHMALHPANMPLIVEMAEANTYGPTFPSLYKELRRYGSDILPFLWNFQDSQLSDFSKSIIEAVYESYNSIDYGKLLIMLTHKGTPYSMVEFNSPIPHVLIYKHYKNFLDEAKENTLKTSVESSHENES